jgi:hypothetical protein
LLLDRQQEKEKDREVWILFYFFLDPKMKLGTPYGTPRGLGGDGIRVSVPLLDPGLLPRQGVFVLRDLADGAVC